MLSRGPALASRPCPAPPWPRRWPTSATINIDRSATGRRAACGAETVAPSRSSSSTKAAAFPPSTSLSTTPGCPSRPLASPIRPASILHAWGAPARVAHAPQACRIDAGRIGEASGLEGQPGVVDKDVDGGKAAAFVEELDLEGATVSAPQAARRPVADLSILIVAEVGQRRGHGGAGHGRLASAGPRDNI